MTALVIVVGVPHRFTARAGCIATSICEAANMQRYRQMEVPAPLGGSEKGEQIAINAGKANLANKTTK